MTSILQIVPSLPPTVSGLGDYAVALAGALRANFGIESHFLVPDPATFSSLETNQTILVQYVGYGYHKRGAPLWLPAGLAEAKRRNSSLRILTMFHELYAFGPPWRSSFWLSPRQRRIVKDLMALSGGVVTNCPLATATLSRWAPGRVIHTMPTPSNIGEPSDLRPFESREPVVALFGQSPSRMQAWQALQKTPGFLKHLGAEEIWDIGPGNCPSLPVKTKIFGRLEHAEISALLLRARYGLISTPWRRLSRSGVFAAYAVHGTVPVVLTAEEDTCPNLDPARHFLRATSLTQAVHPDKAKAVVSAVREWYGDHSLTEHARLFSSLIG